MCHFQRSLSQERLQGHLNQYRGHNGGPTMFFTRSFTSGNTNANWMRDYNPVILRGGASLYTSFRKENVYRFAIFKLRPYAGPIAAICRALSRNNAG
jgi:hypothetical protein